MAAFSCQSTIDDDTGGNTKVSTFTVYTTADGLSDNTVVDIAVDHLRKGVWCATLNGVSFYSSIDSTIVAFGAESDIPKMETESITVDYMTGNVWVGTVSGAAWYDVSWHALVDMDSLAHRYITTITAASDGSLWFGTKGGLSRYDAFGSWKTYRSTTGLPGDLVTAVAIDAVNAVWVATTNGVGVMNGRTWKTFGASVLPNPYATSLLHSFDGSVWIGTVAGIAVYTDGSWDRYGTVDGLPSPGINDIAEDYQKTVWAATDGGVARFSGGKWTELKLPDKVKSERVFSVAADIRNGVLWIGTGGGLVRYRQR